MSMRKCPVCHEMYSDTYKACPFCEEEAALKKGKKIQRHGGRRVAKGGFDPSGAIITILLLAVLGLGVYFIFGDAIAQSFGIREPVEDNTPNTTEPDHTDTDTSEPDSTDPGTDPGTEPTDPDTDPDTKPDEPAAPATPVTLVKNDITVNDSLGLTAKLLPQGGSGSYTWSSSNSAVVSVNAEGMVTGLATGNATITVSDGYTTATCIVRVTKN